jgi:hypothetical protein
MVLNNLSVFVKQQLNGHFCTHGHLTANDRELFCASKELMSTHMTRYPRKFKRIKRVQMVERPIPGFTRLHPETDSKYFTDSKTIEAEKIKLEKQGWRHIHFDLKPSGLMVAYGQRIGKPVVLENAAAGHYDLYLKPPNLGLKLN